MKFSIVVPIYNVESYLKSCIDSILQQTYTDFEMVLVDDGSTDKSPEICDEYAKNDARIVVCHKKNGGLGAARNDGIRLASGDFVAFVDSDDYWDDPDTLRKLADKIDSEDPDVIESKRKTIRLSDGYSSKSPGFPLDQLQSHDTIENVRVLIATATYEVSAALKVVRRSFLLEHDLFFPVGVTTEDILWAIRLSAAKPRMSFLGIWYYVYRKDRPGSITSTIKEKNLKDFLFVIEGSYTAAEKAEPELGKLLRHYLLYQCMIALAINENLKTSNADKKTYRNRIYCLCRKELKETGINPKARKCQLVYRLFGFRALSVFLGKYLKHRKE